MEQEKTSEQIAPQQQAASLAVSGAEISPGAHKPSTKKIVEIVLLTIATILVLGFIGVAIYLSLAFRSIGAAISKCDNGRAHLYSQEPKITSEFNNLALISDQPNVTAKVTKQDGDCVDSLPTIFERKTYVISTSAGTAFDEINTALVKAGYTASTDDIYAPSNPCKYQNKPYRFTNTATKSTIEIILTCSQDSGSDQDWRQIPVTKATADLTVNWEYLTE